MLITLLVNSVILSIFRAHSSKKTNPNMLELSKKVLEKVSFDRSLFHKELVKAVSWLKKDEVPSLKVWCLASFAMYNDVILEVFDTI